MEGQYATQDEAIRAAIDSMESGDTLVVHEEDCRIAKRTLWFGLRRCTCNPKRWTCP
jgi:hypothetical protein